VQLIYQTTDVARAEEIAEVLDRAGIETSIHGIHSSSIEGTSVTVWVANDADLARANEVLRQFFASEAPARPLPAFRPEGSSLRLWLLLGAAALCLAVAFGFNLLPG
jgi:hypothetical protein